MVRKSKNSASGPSQRQLRVGEELRHQLSALLMRQETHIEALDSVPITVVEVSVSPDMSNAHVYVMSLGGEDIDVILPALNEAAPYLQHQIASQIHLKRMPKLRFSADTSFDNAEKMAKIFAKLN
jgi:ribosome-binding factor A